MLEKDGQDQLDRPYENWRSITQSQGGREYLIYNKKKEAQLDGSHLAQKPPSNKTLLKKCYKEQ
jgi:hypothetical protein